MRTDALRRTIVRALLGMLCAAGVHAEDNAPQALLAVASNFSALSKDLADAFAAEHPGTVAITSGSTGKLCTQIQNGAPFDVFLSADRVHPEKLVAEGHAIATTRFTYAIGRLALYSKTLPVAAQGAEVLKATTVQHVSIANPETAPYGVAAVEALKALKQWDLLNARVVYGENIAQAFQFTQSGAAELGFVAYAQVLKEDATRYWLVPETLHTPLMQDAVLLKHGEKNETARAFLAYLQTDAARDLIARSGYRVPEKP